MSSDKRACMARAQALLATPTPESLRYAALELRLCIEELTYEKLRAFSDMVPESVVATWQPPQAVKALLEFEPAADQSFTIFAGIEERQGVESKNMQYVGQHNALRLNWLRKHYNKLGSLLHSSPSGASAIEDIQTTAAYLNEVIADLAEPLTGNILGGSIRTVFAFECAQCKKQVICNKEAAAKNRKAVCFNPQCGAEYFAAVTDDGDATFHLMVTEFDCATCKGLIPVENRKLDIGVQFVCPACGSKHRIVSRQWGYGIEEA